MKAPDFDYLRPSSLGAAIESLAAYGGEAMPLAGGQSLMPMMNFRVAAPAALIDLNALPELAGIRREGDTLRIGAMTRYAQMMRDPLVADCAPLITMALPYIAHDAIRNRGTIGGSLALADPAAELPAIMLALSADIEAAGPDGTRSIPAASFFKGTYETALAPTEIITAIHIPAATPSMRFGFYELAQRHGDYALAGVAIARDGDTWRCAFFGVTDRPIIVPALDAALAAAPNPAEASAHLGLIDFNADAKATAATRQRLAAVALTRAIEGMRP